MARKSGSLQAPTSGRPDAPGAWTRLCLLLTLFSFSIAQPLYDLLGRAPEFFIFRHFEPTDFALFVTVVSLLLPAAGWLAIELVGLVLPRARGVLHALSLGLLCMAAAVPWLHSVAPSRPSIAVALSGAAGAAAATLILTRRGARNFVLLLTPAVVVFAAILLLRPGIRELWWLRAAAIDGGEAGGTTTPPMMILVFDALPTASLMDGGYGVDEVRYPAFSRLAREGTWYRRNTTVSTQTTQAVPAILGGQCPGSRKHPTFESHPKNLFTLLDGVYDLDVIETVTRLCPPEVCAQEVIPFRDRFYPLLQDAAIVAGHRLLPPAWAKRLPPVDRNWGGFTADGSEAGRPKRNPREVEIERYREMLGRIESDSKPTLRFAHVVLPHEPFVYLPSGTIYRGGAEPGGSWKTLADDPWVAWHSYQRHLLQLGFVDRLLGELLEALDKAGVYDETLLVVTADHGSSFVPGEARRQLEDENVIDIVAVPLLVKLPFQRAGGADDTPIQIVDILPLIAAAMGIEPPSWVDGHLPSTDSAGGPRALSCAEIANRYAIELTEEALREAADRKIALFGTGAEGVFPRVGPQPEVVGLAAPRGECPRLPGVEVTLENAPLFEDVQPASGFVPAEIVGTVFGPQARDLDLAIAVNGTVRATTRPYRLGTAGATFSAVVPEDTLVPGRNEIAVFAIRQRGSCRLAPLGGVSSELSFLDTRLGAWADPRVNEAGFGKTEQISGRVIRWTNGRGRLEVPLTPEQAARLRALRVDLGAVGKQGSEVRIVLDETELFKGRVEAVPWSVTLPVDNVRVRNPARIRVLSDTFVVNRRNYGVAVEGVWLLSDG